MMNIENLEQQLSFLFYFNSLFYLYWLCQVMLSDYSKFILILHVQKLNNLTKKSEQQEN